MKPTTQSQSSGAVLKAIRPRMGAMILASMIAGLSAQVRAEREEDGRQEEAAATETPAAPAAVPAVKPAAASPPENAGRGLRSALLRMAPSPAGMLSFAALVIAGGALAVACQVRAQVRSGKGAPISRTASSASGWPHSEGVWLKSEVAALRAVLAAELPPDRWLRTLRRLIREESQSLAPASQLPVAGRVSDAAPPADTQEAPRAEVSRMIRSLVAVMSTEGRRSEFGEYVEVPVASVARSMDAAPDPVFEFELSRLNQHPLTRTRGELRGQNFLTVVTPRAVDGGPNRVVRLQAPALEALRSLVAAA